MKKDKKGSDVRGGTSLSEALTKATEAIQREVKGGSATTITIIDDNPREDARVVEWIDKSGSVSSFQPPKPK